MKPDKIEVNANIEALSEIEGKIDELITQTTSLHVRLKLDIPNSPGGMSGFIIERFRDGVKSTKAVNGSYQEVITGGIANYIDTLSLYKKAVFELNQIIINNKK